MRSFSALAKINQSSYRASKAAGVEGGGRKKESEEKSNAALQQLRGSGEEAHLLSAASNGRIGPVSELQGGTEMLNIRRAP